MSDGGWYPDPAGGGPGRLRWWDGGTWTDHVHDPGTGPAGTPPPRIPTAALPAGLPTGPVPIPPPPRPAGQRARILVAGAVVAALALVIGAVLVTRGGNTLVPAAAQSSAAAPTSTAASPTPTVTATPEQTASPKPKPKTPGVPGCAAASLSSGPRLLPPKRTGTGPRITDAAAGISWQSPGEPWLPFTMGPWSTKGAGASFNTGFYLIADRNTPNGDYYATAVSGTVARPAGAGQSCLAEEVAADIRIAFYPQPNARRTLSAKPVVVDGYGGYVVHMQLSFNAAGYATHSERVSVLVLNTGRPRLAVMFISIPNLVQSYNWVIDQAFASIKVS